jgi:SMODS-associated and fused to various effectors sensor domain
MPHSSGAPTPATEDGRSASAARLIGDDVQHLVGLYWALKALLSGETILSVALEARRAGNVDDVVVKRHPGTPDTYYQVKTSVDDRHPANAAWLMQPSPAKGPSILQKFYGSWRTITASGGAVELALVTTRGIDPGDAVLRLCDRHETVATGLRQASPRSLAGRARAEWANHLGVSEAQLLDFLSVLRFLHHGSEASWRERVQTVMQGLGLRHDDQAVTIGLAEVRDWVKDGRRELTVDQLREAINRLDLRIAEPEALLVVQALGQHPRAEDAVVALDWVTDFEGDNPRTRRRPHDTGMWNGKFRTELHDAAHRIKVQGYTRVLVQGNMRLPCWFAVGAEFSSVAGFAVACQRGSSTWSSTTAPSPCSLAHAEAVLLDQGDDLAIGLAIATDPSEDVLAYLRSVRIPVSAYICLSPADGASGVAVRDEHAAIGLAREIRQQIREQCRTRGVKRLHLFLAMPSGLALLLGHLWDRLPTTLIYADLVIDGYEPAFSFP